MDTDPDLAPDRQALNANSDPKKIMLVLLDTDPLLRFFIPFPSLLTCRLFSLAQLLSELVVLLEDPVPVQQGGVDLPPGKKKEDT